MPGDNQIERVGLGRTDVTVSKICFGTSGIGDAKGAFGYTVDEDRALATARAILHSPVKFLDTSRAYGLGKSEERIGRAIRDVGGLPEGFVVATKLDCDQETGAFDADEARRSLEASLKALGLDRVPILHLHDPEHARSLAEVTGPGGALPELFKIKEEGLVDAIGLAAGKIDMMMAMLKDWDFDVVLTHNRFTLTNRNAEPLIAFAASKGMAVFNAAPYNGGVFAKGSATFPRYAYQEASGERLDPVRRVEAICARHGVPTGAAALQFSMRDPRVTATVCGVTRPERIDETVAWANWPIGEEVWAELTALPFDTNDPWAPRG